MRGKKGDKQMYGKILLRQLFVFVALLTVWVMTGCNQASQSPIEHVNPSPALLVPVVPAASSSASTLERTPSPLPVAAQRVRTVVVPTDPPTIDLSEISPWYTIDERDYGKTFTYTLTIRFDVILDAHKHPLINLALTECDIIGYVSNRSVSGPNNYPIGFEVTRTGTCVLRNGDFWVRIVAVDGL